MTNGYLPSRIDRLSSWRPGGNAVLMYHSVGERYPEGKILSTDDFREHLEFLTTNYRIVDLPDVFDGGDERRIALTFDAGYENFYTQALPILREFDAPSTQFIIPERVGLQNEKTGDSTIWNEWFTFMDETQLRELVDDPLVTLGNKSRTHVSILPAIRDEATLRDEIVGGKRTLEERFDVEINRYCYGSGRFDPECVAVVREGHEYAVTTQRQFVTDDTDPCLIPRFDVDFIDRETLEGRLSATEVARRQARRWFKRQLGSWYPWTDPMVRYSFVDHVDVADKSEFGAWYDRIRLGR